MLYRCENPKAANYANYGGRGVKVCAEWHDFLAFRRDVGARPSRAHSIDRIDVNGDYEPGNVRWATPAEQSANTRTCFRIECDGEALTLRSAAKRLGHGSEHRLRDFMRQHEATAQQAFDYFRGHELTEAAA